MTKRINGLAKWILVIAAVVTIMLNTAGIIWNAATLQNEITHLTADVKEIKMDIKAINTYLLERRNQ